MAIEEDSSDEEGLAPCTAAEARAAMWVAAHAARVCKSFIEKGRPDADDFVALCAAMEELRGVVRHDCEFAERAEELYQVLAAECQGHYTYPTAAFRDGENASK